ncbi:MAG TPA: DNA gyrase inhibitor YacG [Pyrinomonadaceae bacterium]|nr:DNA gyrase inhibitor YacG [Pyrinomonadaceae bacterium]
MMILSCPACGTETEYHGNENRPFCSERCRLLDFGAWVDEKYALPAESSELSDEDIEQLETAAQQDVRR